MFGIDLGFKSIASPTPACPAHQVIPGDLTLDRIEPYMNYLKPIREVVLHYFYFLYMNQRNLENKSYYN